MNKLITLILILIGNCGNSQTIQWLDSTKAVVIKYQSSNNMDLYKAYYKRNDSIEQIIFSEIHVDETLGAKVFLEMDEFIEGISLSDSIYYSCLVKKNNKYFLSNLLPITVYSTKPIQNIVVGFANSVNSNLISFNTEIYINNSIYYYINYYLK